MQVPTLDLYTYTNIRIRIIHVYVYKLVIFCFPPPTPTLQTDHMLCPNRRRRVDSVFRFISLLFLFNSVLPRPAVTRHYVIIVIDEGTAATECNRYTRYTIRVQCTAVHPLYYIIYIRCRRRREQVRTCPSASFFLHGSHYRILICRG